MKRLYRNCFRLVSILALVVCPQGVSLSCGPHLGLDEGRFALFRAEMAGASLAPFYYTHHFLNTAEEDPAVADRLENCREWSEYTRGVAKLKDIYHLQYHTSPDDFLYAVYTGNWSQFADNSFVSWLRKHPGALEYMSYAKKLEFQQLGDKDPWRDQPGPDYTDPRQKSLEGFAAAEKIAAAGDSFLRLRWAFQALKEAYYRAYYSRGYAVVDGQEARKIYEQELKGKQSIVARWGLLYYALSHTDRIARTRYLLQAFDQTEEKKQFVYNWLDAEILEELKQQTADRQLLALVEVMKGIRTPGRALPQIQRLYQLDAGSKYLPLLISREVNKLEDWIWSQEMLGFSDRISNTSDQRQEPDYAAINSEKDLAYLGEFRSFLYQLIQDRKTDEGFVRLALAHCYQLQGDFYMAARHIEMLPELQDPSQQRQAQIEKLVNLAYTADLNLPEVQDSIHRQLRALEQAGIAIRSKRHDAWAYGLEETEQEDDMKEILLMLSRAFRAKGNIVAAGLLYQKADLLTNQYDGWDDGSVVNYNKIAWFDRNATPEDIARVVAFKHRKDKTPFEEYISPATWAPDDLYLDLKGTKLLRMKNYHAAQQAFEQVSDSFWLKNYQYKEYLPKKSIASVGTLLPVANAQVPLYSLPSKKLVMRELNGLLGRYATVNNSDSLAELSFLLGNCFFNISFWGKGWMMYSYGRSIWELEEDHYGFDYDWAFYRFLPDGKKYGYNYYRLHDARQMYRRALEHTGNNRELKAKSLMMLWLTEQIARDEAGNNRKYFAGDYRKAFEQYSNTRVYELALTHCPDLQRYLEGGVPE